MKCEYCGADKSKPVRFPCAHCSDEIKDSPMKRWVIKYDLISERQCNCGHYVDLHSGAGVLTPKHTELKCVSPRCNCPDFKCKIIEKVDVVTSISKKEAISGILSREKGLRPEFGFYFSGGIEADKYVDGMDLHKPEFMKLEE